MRDDETVPRYGAQSGSHLSVPGGKTHRPPRLRDGKKHPVLRIEHAPNCALMEDPSDKTRYCTCRL